MIFRLMGDTEQLSLKLEHPLHLGPNVQYYMALTGFYCDNRFINSFEDALIMFYREGEDAVYNQFVKGYVRPKVMVNQIRKFMIRDQLITEEESKGFNITLDSDLKWNIKSPVKCHINNGMRRLFGFGDIKDDEIIYDTQYVAEKATNVYYNSEGFPQIKPFKVLEVHCNLVTSSFVNHNKHWHKHEDTLILYHLNPKEYDDYIAEKPKFLDYIPIRSDVRTIREIQIALVNERGDFVQNSEGGYIVYLKLVSENELFINKK